MYKKKKNIFLLLYVLNQMGEEKIFPYYLEENKNVLFNKIKLN